MKRSAFKVQRPPAYRREAKQVGAEYTLRPRAVAIAVAGPARLVVAVRKELPIQHAGYMNAVRSLACHRCGKPPRSEFAHSDIGKGAGIKTDCRLGWPGCTDCHFFVGSTGAMGKAGRRDFEEAAARMTREAIRRMGQWPATLPEWAPDFEDAAA